MSANAALASRSSRITICIVRQLRSGGGSRKRSAAKRMEINRLCLAGFRKNPRSPDPHPAPQRHGWMELIDEQSSRPWAGVGALPTVTETSGTPGELGNLENVSALRRRRRLLRTRAEQVAVRQRRSTPASIDTP